MWTFKTLGGTELFFVFFYLSALIVIKYYYVHQSVSSVFITGEMYSCSSMEEDNINSPSDISRQQGCFTSDLPVATDQQLPGPLHF